MNHKVFRIINFICSYIGSPASSQHQIAMYVFVAKEDFLYQNSIELCYLLNQEFTFDSLFWLIKERVESCISKHLRSLMMYFICFRFIVISLVLVQDLNCGRCQSKFNIHVLIFIYLQHPPCVWIYY